MTWEELFSVLDWLRLVEMYCVHTGALRGERSVRF
jgi:hypothetical protein